MVRRPDYTDGPTVHLDSGWNSPRVAIATGETVGTLGQAFTLETNHLSRNHGLGTCVVVCLSRLRKGLSETCKLQVQML